MNDASPILQFHQFLQQCKPSISPEAQAILDQAEAIRQEAIDRHARYSDEKVMRLLVGAVNSLRYWSTGFEEDDEQANDQRWFFDRQVEQLLDVLKARGIR